MGPSAPVRLDQPYYGASLGVAIARFFKKYVTFSGRASRSEFWWWFLVNQIISTVIAIPALLWYMGAVVAMMNSIDLENNTNPFGYGYTDPYYYVPDPTGPVLLSAGLVMVWTLGTFIPSLALYWRRLHDAGYSGAFYLLSLAGLGIVPLIMCILPSKPEGARFDAVPPGGFGGRPSGYAQPGGGYGQPYGQGRAYGQAGYGQPGGAYAPPGYGQAPGGPGVPPPLSTPMPPAEPQIGPDGLPRYPG
jgi:uncharacterized membrane protein YhaH (DUF805 family)